MNRKQVTSHSYHHLEVDARVQWEKAHPTKDDPQDHWSTSLTLSGFPHGMATLTFFGTEAQIKAIAGQPTQEAEEALEILRTIEANAQLHPDPRMDGTTDTFLVPLDDIERAMHFLNREKPSRSDD